MNTVFPIVLGITIGTIMNIYRGFPKFNFKMVSKALGFLFIGACFFVRGLDEDEDYLRFNHFTWHLFASITGFYM